MAFSLLRRRSGSAGYTLIEMLIVLGLVTALATLSWPALRKPLDKARLRDAAKQIRVELARTRLKAVQTGVAHRFRYQPGNNLFEIGPLWAEPERDEPEFNSVGNAELGSMPPLNASGHQSLQKQTRRKRLSDGVQFADLSLRIDDPLDFPDSQNQTQSDPELEDASPADENQFDWSAPIVFQSNGSTKNAHIVLVGQRGFHVEVTLRGLTAAATIGDLQRRGVVP